MRKPLTLTELLANVKSAIKEQYGTEYVLYGKVAESHARTAASCGNERAARFWKGIAQCVREGRIR